jgi:tetratricopeptide (TPR) repeat protein
MCYRPLLLLSILISTVCCLAQSGSFPDSFSPLGFRASLTGVVRDNANRPVNGARVEVLDTYTGRSVSSTFSLTNGTYVIDNLRHGSYEIVATSGLAEQRTRIDIDGDREVSFRLPVTPVNADSGSTVSVSQMKVPGKARRLLQKAEDAFRKARFDDAFKFVQKALGMCPDYARALTLRGILSMQKGDNKDAQPDLEKAVQLDYGDDLGFIALASLYNNQGMFDRAQQTLEHGISLNPNSWQANMELARAQIGQQQYGAAIRSLDRAISMAPENVAVMHLFRAQALIGLKDYSSAIGELESYLSKSPDGPNSDQARTTLAQLKQFSETARK